MAEQDVDVSRRDLATLFGALGGAVGLAALAACSDDQRGGGSPLPESVGLVKQPWTTADGGVNGTNFLWVDTIKGLGSVHAGTTLYSMDAGSDATNASSPVVVVGGYWTPGDGGGGVFYWSNASITDDGGTKIVPATSGGDGGVGATGPGWIRLYSGPLNARWFGAKGATVTADGSVVAEDDTPAIAAALAAIPQSGGELYIPAGTYTITSTLTLASHTTIRGVFGSVVDNSGTAPGGTVLRWAGSANQAVLKVYGVEYVVIDGLVVDVYGVSCSGIYIDSSNAPATHNIVLRNFSVCNSSQVNALGIGVQIGPLTGSSSCPSGDAGTVGCQMDRIRLENFYLLDLTTGISINSANAADAGVIDQGTFQNVATGINLIACGYIIIRSCAFGQASGAVSIQVSGDPINMLIESCQTEGAGKMFVIASGASPDSAYPIVLQNNIFNVVSEAHVYRRIISIANYFSASFNIYANNFPLTSIDDRFGAGASFAVQSGVTGVQIFSVSPGASTGQMALTPLSVPQTTLNGLVNGANNDLAIGNASWIRVGSGPTGPFSISGFAGPTDGRVVHVFSPLYGMTIQNAGASALGHQILTLTGHDVTLGSGPSVASFIYDTAAGYWILRSYWCPTAPVAVTPMSLVGQTTGTSSPAAGGAGALPATPKGYLAVSINGSPQQIPYY